MSLNKVILEGNIGKIEDTRYLPNGEPVVNFSLATDEPYKEGNEWKTRASWHRIVAFGDSFKRRLEHAKPGSNVAIVGRLRYREWTPDDGVKRIRAEILLEEFSFVGGKRQSSGSSDGETGSEGEAAGDGHDDGTPFDEQPAAAPVGASASKSKGSRGSKRTGSSAAS
ncbi:single-stranded DNA-binding protein [Paraburkholderia sp. SIMBA_009]